MTTSFVSARPHVDPSDLPAPGFVLDPPSWNGDPEETDEEAEAGSDADEDAHEVDDDEEAEEAAGEAH